MGWDGMAGMGGAALTVHREADGRGGAGEERPVGAQGELCVAAHRLPVVAGPGGQRVADGDGGAAGGGGEAVGAEGLRAAPQRHRQVGHRGAFGHAAPEGHRGAHRHRRHRVQLHPGRLLFGGHSAGMGASQSHNPNPTLYHTPTPTQPKPQPHPNHIPTPTAPQPYPNHNSTPTLIPTLILTPALTLT